MSLIPLLEECNQHCLFCAAEDRKESLSYEHNLAVINRQLADGMPRIILSGGETTLCPDLFRFIRHIRSKGADVEVQSNGLTSSNPKVAKALVLSGVKLFNINFPSHIPEINDKITGTKDTLPKRLAGVKNLLSFGGNVRLTHIVTSLNYKNLPGFIEFVSKEMPGVSFIQFSFLKAMGGVLKRPYLLPSYEEVSPFLQEAFRLCEINGIDAITDHIPPCFLGRYYAKNVDYIKTGEGADTSLPESEKKKLPACEGCSFGSRCFGPREDYMQVKKTLDVKPVKNQ